MFNRSIEDVLSESVIIDVISRLPVKSIISCKCVCKNWRNIIISDPYFVDLHLSRSHLETLMINDAKVFDWPGTLNKGLKIIGHEKVNYHLPEPEVKILLDLNKQHFVPLMDAGSKLCSVNGLICYSQQDGSVCVCNPILGEHMTLPPPPLRENLKPKGYGFGVSREGEYKVIRISVRKRFRNPRESGMFSAVEIEVYTLGTDHQWRSLGESPFRLYFNWSLGGGLFDNNNVYWLPCDLGLSRMYVFNLSTERFAEFPSPFPSPLSPEFYRWRSRLGVLKGRLRCFSWCSNGVEVWVLKQEEELIWCQETVVIQEQMKPSPEFGVWQRLYIIDGLNGTRILLVYVPKVHKLMAYCLDTTLPLNTSLFFPNETNIDGKVDCFFYHPSFVKLNNLGSDNRLVGGVKKTQEKNACFLG